mmetsp:Transcript_26682/g.25526  ORF Transcript_26682/g.25526 Transcript_26682/m.25526 type:complete len:93 (-) Transcript_26682:221-499(-)
MFYFAQQLIHIFWIIPTFHRSYHGYIIVDYKWNFRFSIIFSNVTRRLKIKDRRASSHSAVPQRTMAFIKTRSVGGKYKRRSKRGESNENRKK